MRLYFRNVHETELKYAIHSKGGLHCNKYLQEESLFSVVFGGIILKI